MHAINGRLSYSHESFSFHQRFGGLDPARASEALSALHGCYGRDLFGGYGGVSSSSSQLVGLFAMPDFHDAGRLDVDKKAGVVTTPGGYKVSVADGRVRVQNPDGKFTDIKAEPPNNTVSSTTVGKETRQVNTVEQVLRRDPAVRESDGDVWRFSGNGSFLLPDGTKISVQEQGEGKDLHISGVDIYNGNKHVHVDSHLDSAAWKTVKTDVTKTPLNDWQTTATNRSWQGNALVRTDTQQRDVSTTTVQHQVADQKFTTTFGEVRRDGWRHDAATDDGLTFRLAGKNGQIAWAKDGREVLSGAGKGKDDKTKEYQLGNAIDPSWQGYRPIEVPWNVYALHSQSSISSWFGGRYGLGGGGGFGHGACGPIGGSSYFGARGWDGNAYARFAAMQAAVGGLCGVYGGLGDLSRDLGGRRHLAPIWA